MSGTYTVSLSNSLGSLTSAPARLTVVYPPVFLSAVRSNCTLALTYSTMPGQRYRLQSKRGRHRHQLGLSRQFRLPDQQLGYRLRQRSAPTASASTASCFSRRPNSCPNKRKAIRVPKAAG